MKSLVAMLVMVCAGCVTQPVESTDPGCGGTGGSSTNSTPIEVCGDCRSADDCHPSSNVCMNVACVNGRCTPQNLSPEYTCEGENHCWSGACCFTCIADMGANNGILDVFDGPCVSGQDNHACGNAGGLCQDCTLSGKECIGGQCVNTAK